MKKKAETPFWVWMLVGLIIAILALIAIGRYSNILQGIFG